MTLIDQANNRGEVYLAAFPFKVVCLLILVGLMVGCSGGAAKEKEAMAATSRAIPVAVSPAALKDMPVYLDRARVRYCFQYRECPQPG